VLSSADLVVGHGSDADAWRVDQNERCRRHAIETRDREGGLEVAGRTQHAGIDRAGLEHTAERVDDAVMDDANASRPLTTSRVRGRRLGRPVMVARPSA
jgi:hypothetical protein